MRKRAFLIFMYICSFILSIAPLAIYLIINHERYIGVREDVIKLSFGGLICTALVLFKILGRLKAPSSTVCLGIFFILSYLLKSITDDLLVLSFLALLGDIGDKIFLSLPISRIRSSIAAEKTADATASKLEEIIERYYRGEKDESGS